ncbi:apolipoprotein D-like isoform X2 [Homalodisca vitripennis]|uniref:apolipoprotein D-like isoform X2 n=1 Tax=Homalodisca vitripennis TaxID=197043 RepID=UPI001EEA18AD|nr:apolipoprotein D-like isoform X2 [Homalodisca vitripennis]
MRRILAAVLCLFSLLVQGEAFNWPHWGRCKNLPVEQDFNVYDYMSYWYQQAGYNTEDIQYNLRCVHALYQFDSSNNVVSVDNMAIRNIDNKHQGINGTAVLADPSKDEGRLVVTFHPYWWFTVKGNYWVLGTDYQSYSVVYSCSNFFFFFHYDSIWYLSREQNFPPRTEALYFNATNSVLIANGLDPSILKRTSQQNCNV